MIDKNHHAIKKANENKGIEKKGIEKKENKNLLTGVYNATNRNIKLYSYLIKSGHSIYLPTNKLNYILDKEEVKLLIENKDIILTHE